jgi:hypothetical protein
MNKKFFSLALTALGSFFFTGCINSEDDDNNYEAEIVVTEGAFVVNSGNSTNGIKGSLSYIDYEADTSREIASSLGDTPNDVIVYGDKVYVTVTGENTVVVFDRKTFRQVKVFSTTDQMGQEEGVGPRCLEAEGSNVFVTTRGGYVGVIDTVSLGLRNMYKVGVNPEGITVVEGEKATFLYVANNGNTSADASISVINLSNTSVSEIRNDKFHCPRQIAAAGEILYVLDDGYIDADGIQQEAGLYVYNGATVMKVIADATGMSASGYGIITYNNPIGSSSVSYSVFHVLYGTLSVFPLSGDNNYRIQTPTAISVDPNTGNVLIASRTANNELGTPLSTEPGFVNIYTSNGEFMKSYPVGVEPSAITFQYKLAKLSDYQK